MSYLIDTHMPSELRRKLPHARVKAPFAQRPAGTLHLRVPTLGDLRKGIQALNDPLPPLAVLDWRKPNCRRSFRAAPCLLTRQWPTAGAAW